MAGLDDPRRFGEFGHCAAAGSVGVGNADLFVRSILEMKLEADIQFIWPRLVLLTQRVPGEDILDLQWLFFTFFMICYISPANGTVLTQYKYSSQKDLLKLNKTYSCSRKHVNCSGGYPRIELGKAIFD